MKIERHETDCPVTSTANFPYSSTPTPIPFHSCYELDPRSQQHGDFYQDTSGMSTTTTNRVALCPSFSGVQ